MPLSSLIPKNPRWRMLALAGAVVVAVAALIFWWHASRWESTDNAQIDGHVSPISARVGGHVLRVNCDDNQFVKAGAVLVQVDPTDYGVALEKARAEYEEALAGARQARVTVPVTSGSATGRLEEAEAAVANARAGVTAARKRLDAARARLKEARANNVRDQKDLARGRVLVDKGVIPRQQFDRMQATAVSSAATAEAAAAASVAAAAEVAQARGDLSKAQAEYRSARTAPQQIEASRFRAEEAAAAVRRAKAALDQAELNLRYTSVVAPVDGIVGRRIVEVGQNVLPGQPLLSLVPVKEIWVTANFKETQLRNMRPGQEAKISVDTYRRTYAGHVESIGAASGSRFSLFPPENATGNYVKVVQRIPVRLRLDRGQDREHLLRPGMSVEPKVKVK